MADNLVKILRDGWTEDGICDDFDEDVLLIAADRIEELEKSIRNMQQDVAFLRRLQAAGVDNWEGYEFALGDDDD
jgi:hypothetical protein